MGIISESKARRALDPHLHLLYTVVTEAFDRWRRDFAPQFAAAPTARARANVLHELMVQGARKAFDSVRGVQMIEAAGRTVLRIAPRTIPEPVLVQFKKLTPEGMPRNYPTQTALAFDAQVLVPGIPTDARITIGYRLNRLATAIIDVLAVCTDGDQPAWSFELLPPVAATTVAHPTFAAPTRSKTRLRPKPGALPKRKRTSDGSGGESA